MVMNWVRAAAVAWVVGCGLVATGPWQPAQAAPVVFHKATDNGTTDDAGRFTVALNPGSAANQAAVQLFTSGDPGSRITGLYVQDGTGAVARDGVSGGPVARLAETQIHEVVLDDPGGNRLRVIRALASALGISPSEALILVNRAPTVIRTGSTPAANEALKQVLENAGARVTLSSRQDPAVPPGANVGVSMPGAAPSGYDVVLDEVGSNKIGVIRLVSDLTGRSLAEALQLVNAAPAVVLANASPDEAAAARQALRDRGATVQLQPVGGTPAQPIALPPGSTGIAPDFTLGFMYEDPDASPTLQLTLQLGVLFSDLLDAWQDGRFLLGLRVTDRNGVSDLYLAANAAPPGEVPEPPTGALLCLAVLGLLRRWHGARPHSWHPRHPRAA